MKVHSESLEAGAIWRVLLNAPKANILDAEMIDQLGTLFTRARDARSLKAILIEGAGPHFSFGASVEEHRPGRCEALIRGFHGVFESILDSHVVTLAAVRGQCLGGALELAAFCHRLFASPDARFGQPEIRLGVFAPVASVSLAERIGRSRAEDLCLSGRSLTAEQGLTIGLVDELAEDPSGAALAYAKEHLVPRSAESLRIAVRAVREGFATRFRAELAAVERLYLDELMLTPDAAEGLNAFLEKRTPSWSDA